MQNLTLNKFNLASSLILGLSLTGFSQSKANAQLNQFNSKSTSEGICFTENKGQVFDQNKQSRPDVLFGGESKGLIFHLRNNGISYQLNRVDAWKTAHTGLNDKINKHSNIKKIDKSTIYRVDINWLAANKEATITTENELPGYSNFYTQNGGVTVKSFGRVTYQNLYKGISLKWYEKNGELKYDYVCEAGARYSQIKLQIEGAPQLSINSAGELVITTPLGTIVEKAPVVVQAGRTLPSKWNLNDNIVSFEIENLNKKLAYVIDPAIRSWGTYYGGSAFEIANSCATYTNGDVYLAGGTSLNTSTIIATSGSHQSSLGGLDDAFLVKFNSSGVRQWATYYGGSDSDNGVSCAVDGSGNVYLCGITSSTNGISTPGAHQTVFGGGTTSDGFLVKFTSSGVRQWGTYYGGNSDDTFHKCALDPSGNVYVSGTTELTTGTVIATVGTHQSTFGGGFNDAFLVKFNTSGVRQWATYYGGTDVEFGYACSADANNVYLAGVTTSTNAAIPSTGSHQTTHNGGLNDAYFVKFNNSNGARVWATFYGGSGNDLAYGCASDASGKVYLCGTTSSSLTGVIATAASHQSVGATVGDDDGFLVQFDGSGVRQWGTYYGGDDYDYGYSCAVDGANNVYLCGSTSSTLSSAIATSASHQTVLGGPFGTNAYLVKFNTSGVRQWGTYYGGDSDDGYACAVDAGGAIYLAGVTSSTATGVISTVGSHQVNYGGIADGYLVKFIDCSAATPLSATSPSNQAICSGGTTTLSATSGTNTISWYATSTSTSVIATGTNYITPTLTAGTYTYYAEGGSCGSGGSRLAITLTVNASPTVSAANGTICSGQSFTITPQGASTYTLVDVQTSATLVPVGVNYIVSPTVTSALYAYIGANSSGCLSSPMAVAVVVNPSPTVSVNSGTICSGGSFTISPTGATAYTIQGGTATVSPASSTNYTVVGLGSGGCLSNVVTSSVTVETNPIIAVNNGSICPGKSYTIVPTGVATYTIAGGNNVVSPTTNTSYTVTGSTASGCLAQNVATCNITVLSGPTVTSASGSICAGGSFTVPVSGAMTYSLIAGNGSITTSSGTPFVVSPATNSTYIVAGVDANGCEGADFISVSVNAPTVSVSSGSICAGGTYVIKDLQGALTYTIEGGNTSVSPAVTTKYVVRGTDAAGCIGSDTCRVLVDNPVISVNSGSICPSSSFTIVPTGASTYTIQGGKAIVSPTINATYTVQGKSAAGCLAANIATCSVSVIKFHNDIVLPRAITAADKKAEDDYDDLLYPTKYAALQRTFSLPREVVSVEPQTGLFDFVPDPNYFYLKFRYHPSLVTNYTLVVTRPDLTCQTNYTFQVNGDDLTRGWKLPNVITLNADDLNRGWFPSFRGTSAYIGPNYYGSTTKVADYGYPVTSLQIYRLKDAKLIVNTTSDDRTGFYDVVYAKTAPSAISKYYWIPDINSTPAGLYWAILNLTDGRKVETFIDVKK